MQMLKSQKPKQCYAQIYLTLLRALEQKELMPRLEMT